VIAHNDVVEFDEAAVIAALRSAGARFAFVHGSRASGQARPDSDLDVAAWWGAQAPPSWEVLLPPRVDLVVIDAAPLWLAGRIALQGRLLFDDDPPARVVWQADTRLIYLDELPAMLETQREWLEAVAGGR
jgi:polymorphic toxin system nucleotidyltransferase-like protein